MRGLAYRICLTILNLLFPPLAVMILCGAASWDTILNCCLFLLAILPSHIHGFYLTCTYFHRRKKVKKGRYPGDPKPMIFSNTIINGGASNAEAGRLYRKEFGVARRGSGRRRSGSSGHRDMVQRHGSQLGRSGTVSSTRSHRPMREDAHIGRDGYGPVVPTRAEGYPSRSGSVRRGR